MSNKRHIYRHKSFSRTLAVIPPPTAPPPQLCGAPLFQPRLNPCRKPNVMAPCASLSVCAYETIRE
jgi:hypothetical protein